MIDEIVRWASSLAPWQADAVRRMLESTSLSASDVSELYMMLRAEHDLLRPGENAQTPLHPRLGAVSGAPATKVDVALHAIENVRNLNAIPDGKSLRLGTSGLTVVYGKNGSGKSGYARILKRACKARDTKERILPNVLGGQSPSGPARASIKIRVGAEQPKTLDWTDGQQHDVLANVAFFDSKCARISVGEDNAPLYQPYGADVFKRLGDLMLDFKKKLAAEEPKPALPQVPGVHEGTVAGAFARSLSGCTTAAMLDAASAWTPMDDARLAEVEELLAKDPNVLASRLDAQSKRVEQLRSECDRMNEAISPTAVLALHGLYSELSRAEDAARVLAQSLEGEPLTGIGSEVWRTLYEAARDYSTSKAYEGAEFPFLGEEAKCVLCMQPLRPEAAERMARFREFMENRAATAVAEAKNKLKARLEALKQVTVPSADAYVDAIQTLRDRDVSLAAEVVEALARWTARLEALRLAPSPNTTTELPEHLPLSRERFDVCVKALHVEASTLRSQAQPEAQKRLSDEKKELESRRALFGSKALLVRYVADLALLAKHRNCSASLNTLAVSTKGKELVAAALTPQLGKLLRDELAKLDASHLQILPKSRASAGQTLVGLTLDGIAPKAAASLEDVLSEGEHRVVAIAGFLAELRASGHTGPIVLDDPVSSLDHVFRDRIAKRLVEEASARQVVVFTHDISLLLEMQTQASEAASTPMVIVTVERDFSSPGCVEERAPDEAKSFSRMLSDAETDLGSFAAEHTGNRSVYNKKAAALYDRLRGAIEVFVEEELLNKVVRRHTSALQMLRLNGVECTTATVKETQLRYTEGSKWGAAHSNARPLSDDRPKPDEIRAYIEQLRALLKSTKKRRDELEAERRAAQAPVPGRLG